MRGANIIDSSLSITTAKDPIINPFPPPLHSFFSTSTAQSPSLRLPQDTTPFCRAITSSKTANWTKRNKKRAESRGGLQRRAQKRPTKSPRSC